MDEEILRAGDQMRINRAAPAEEASSRLNMHIDQAELARCIVSNHTDVGRCRSD